MGKNLNLRRVGLGVGIVILVAGVSCGQAAQTPTPKASGPPEQKEKSAMTIQVTSTAFKEGEAIPKKHTGEGEDVSPPLKWSDPPEAAKTLALICDDPDAPVGTWVHWVVFGIPATARGLSEGVPKKDTLPDDTKQGVNDFKKIGYNGPMPPPGKAHRYFFKLYALDIVPGLEPQKTTKRHLENAMKGHILAEGQLMGTYKR